MPERCAEAALLRRRTRPPAPVRPRRRPYRPRHAHPAEHEAEKKNGAKDALLLQSLVSARGDVTTHARRIDPGSSGDEGDTI